MYYCMHFCIWAPHRQKELAWVRMEMLWAAIPAADMAHKIAHAQLSDAVKLYNVSFSFPPTASLASFISPSTYYFVDTASA